MSAKHAQACGQNRPVYSGLCYMVYAAPSTQLQVCQVLPLIFEVRNLPFPVSALTCGIDPRKSPGPETGSSSSSSMPLILDNKGPSSSSSSSSSSDDDDDDDGDDGDDGVAAAIGVAAVVSLGAAARGVLVWVSSSPSPGPRVGPTVMGTPIDRCPSSPLPPSLAPLSLLAGCPGCMSSRMKRPRILALSNEDARA